MALQRRGRELRTAIERGSLLRLIAWIVRRGLPEVAVPQSSLCSRPDYVPGVKARMGGFAACLDP